MRSQYSTDYGPNLSPTIYGQSSDSPSETPSDTPLLGDTGDISEVRIAIDDSDSKSHERAIIFSLASRQLCQNNQGRLSATGKAIHQEVDKNLRERARQTLSENGLFLEKVSNAFKDDKELVLIAVKQDPRAFRHASNRLKGDPDIVAIVVKENAHLLPQNHPLSNALAYINDPATFLNNLPENFKNHRGILLEAIRLNGQVLTEVPDPFKSDPTFVLEAIRINSAASSYVVDALKQDTDIAVEIARHNIGVLPENNVVRKVLTGIIDKSLLDDEGNLNVVTDVDDLEAQITNDNTGRRDPIMELSKNENFMKLAVRLDQDCRFFNYVYKMPIHFYPAQILDLIQENSGVWQYLNGSNVETREFALAAVRRNAGVYAYLFGQFQNDIKIAVIAGLKNSELIRNINQEALSQIIAIRSNGNSLRVSDPALLNCREFVLEAVGQDGRALQYASEELRGDRQVVMAAIRQDGRALQFAAEELRGDRVVVMAAIRRDGMILRYASEELRADRVVVMAAIRLNAYALQLASIDLRRDLDVVFDAVRQDSNVLQFAQPEIRPPIRILLRNDTILRHTLRLCSTLVDVGSAIEMNNLINDPDRPEWDNFWTTMTVSRAFLYLAATTSEMSTRYFRHTSSVQNVAIRLNEASDLLFLNFHTTLFLLNFDTPFRRVTQDLRHVEPAFLLVIKLVCLISLCTMNLREDT